MGDTLSVPSGDAFDPWSQASILLGIGTSAREWISLSSTGDLDSTSACLWARTSSFSSTFVLRQSQVAGGRVGGGSGRHQTTRALGRPAPINHS